LPRVARRQQRNLDLLLEECPCYRPGGGTPLGKPEKCEDR
jgi:hypothetical protein